MSKQFKRAEEATLQISEGRKLQTEGTVGVEGGRRSKMGEVISNGREKQTSMKDRLTFPPRMILGSLEIKHEMS